MVTYVSVAGAANPFNGVDIGTYSTPEFADIDGDGDFDVIIGNSLGQFSYFENTGTASTPSYTERTGGANPLNGVDLGDRTYPTLVDIDGDGDLDLFSGELSAVVLN